MIDQCLINQTTEKDISPSDGFLLILVLVIAGLITPARFVRRLHGEWVSAADLKPGDIFVGVDAETLTPHHFMIKRWKGSRVEIE